MVDKHWRELFTGFTARPTLAFEIVAGLFFRRFRPAVAVVLPVLIHTFEPERHPAASRFQISHLELGKLFEHAIGTKIQTREHLLERMTGDMSAELAITIRAALFEHRARAFMDTDRNAEVSGGFIDRKISRAREGPTTELVRATKNSDMTEFFFSEFEFVDRAYGVLQRDQANAVQTFGIVAAVIRKPGVIGPADRRAELRIEIIAPHNVKTQGGEEDADVNTFAIHIANVGGGIELGCERFREGLAPALRCAESKAVIFLFDSGAHPVGIGNGLAINRTARLVGPLDLHTPAKFRRQICFVQIVRLEYVAVGIDDLEIVSHDLTPQRSRSDWERSFCARDDRRSSERSEESFPTSSSARTRVKFFCMISFRAAATPQLIHRTS